MFDARRSVPDEVDWIDVSARRPCPVCGERAGCRTHTDASFAGCSRRPSDWPLTNGLWLHRVSSEVTLPVRSGEATTTNAGSQSPVPSNLQVTAPLGGFASSRTAASSSVSDAVTHAMTQEGVARTQSPPPRERSGRA